MITDMNARVAMAQKLSIPQLQQAIKNGTVPAYVGVPLLQDKMRQQQQMQMAAAQQQQGQQQQQRPIADEVMDQAYEMNGGVDQLPSNLPIQNEEDEENYAGGGIVAFSGKDGSTVQDPDKDPRIVALRQDPSYLAFAENATAEGKDPSLTAFLEAGNTPSRTPAEQNGVDIDRPTTEVMYPNNPDTYPYNPDGSKPDSSPTTNSETASDRAAILGLLKKSWTTSQDIGSAGVRGLGTVADYFNRGLRAVGVPETVAPRVPGQYTFNRGTQGLTPYTDARVASEGGFEANYPVSSQPAAPETASPNIDSQYIAQDMQEGNRGITVAPGARLAPSGTPGATAPAQGGTAPTGGVSPATARQISATNPGAPASLDAAERQAANGSLQASAALTMLDRYVAMMEKSGDDVGRQKKEALYMALIQGGLGMMGGTSPNAFANISAGLLPATQAYQQAIAGIRKDDRARLEKLISTGLKKEEFLLKAEEIGVKRENARLVYDAAIARTGAMAARGSGSSSLDEKREAETFIRANGVLARARKDFNTATADQTYKFNQQLLSNPKAKPEDRKRAQTYIDSINNQYLPAIQEAQEIVNLYRPPNMQTSGGASNVLPMPGSKGELKTGGVYNTARGPAKWDGNQFVSVK
jgi:hypothetical protein